MKANQGPPLNSSNQDSFKISTQNSSFYSQLISGRKMNDKNSLNRRTLPTRKSVGTSFSKCFVTWLFLMILTEISPFLLCQCCLKFEGTGCVQCPQSMHIYNNNCIDDILNCESYQNGTQCISCKNDYQPSTDRRSCKNIDQNINGILFQPNLFLTKNKQESYEEALQSSKILFHGYQQLRDTVQISQSQYIKYYTTDLLQFVKQNYKNKISVQQLKLLKLFVPKVQYNQVVINTTKSDLTQKNGTNINKINSNLQNNQNINELLNNTNYKVIFAHENGIIYLGYRLSIQQLLIPKTNNIKTAAAGATQLKKLKFNITSQQLISKKQTQSFINIDNPNNNSTEIDAIADSLSSYYPQIQGYSPIIVWKGRINNTYNQYNLFFINNGLIQIQAVLPQYVPSPYPVIKLNISGLSPLEKKVIVSIYQSDDFSPYLKQTNLAKATKILKNNIKSLLTISIYQQQIISHKNLPQFPNNLTSYLQSQNKTKVSQEQKDPIFTTKQSKGVNQQQIQIKYIKIYQCLHRQFQLIQNNQQNKQHRHCQQTKRCWAIRRVNFLRIKTKQVFGKQQQLKQYVDIYQNFYH